MPPTAAIAVSESKRYVIVGTSGSGKSTFAQALAQHLGCAHVEMDSLFWGADWESVGQKEFLRRVDAATQGDCWVADGNYTATRPLLWGRATHIIWLNYSRPRTMARVLKRTLQRALTREELWSGNRESLHKSFFSKDSILLWAHTSFARNRLKYTQLQADPDYAHLKWIVFTHPSQTEAFLHATAPSRGTAG